MRDCWRIYADTERAQSYIIVANKHG